MAFRPCDLREAFFVPGPMPASHQGRPGAARGYGTLDALEEVLRSGYFGGTLLRPGGLIYVSARRRKRAGDPAPGDIHMALLLVAKAAERGGARSAPAVRLVQDFGCPDGPAALATRRRPWRRSSAAAAARPAAGTGRMARCRRCW